MKNVPFCIVLPRVCFLVVLVQVGKWGTAYFKKEKWMGAVEDQNSDLQSPPFFKELLLLFISSEFCQVFPSSSMFGFNHSAVLVDSMYRSSLIQCIERKGENVGCTRTVIHPMSQDRQMGHREPLSGAPAFIDPPCFYLRTHPPTHPIFGRISCAYPQRTRVHHLWHFIHMFRGAAERQSEIIQWWERFIFSKGRTFPVTWLWCHLMFSLFLKLQQWTWTGLVSRLKPCLGLGKFVVTVPLDTLILFSTEHKFGWSQGIGINKDITDYLLIICRSRESNLIKSIQSHFSEDLVRVGSDFIFNLTEGKQAAC